MTFVPETRIGGLPPRNSTPFSPPRSPSNASSSPASPSRPMSPRSAMLKNIAGKQAFQSLSHQPPMSPRYIPQSSFRYPSPPSSYLGPSPPPAIHIANGLETNTASPLTVSGTRLTYTSNRGVDSGLLAVKALSEARVAEYRFWRPCGRRACAFGCGGGSEGESRAARRLFRSVEEVGEEQVDVSEGQGQKKTEGEEEGCHEKGEVEVDGVRLVVGSDGEEVAEIRV